jgi:hypothetical protein
MPSSELVDPMASVRAYLEAEKSSTRRCTSIGCGVF